MEIGDDRTEWTCDSGQFEPESPDVVDNAYVDALWQDRAEKIAQRHAARVVTLDGGPDAGGEPEIPPAWDETPLVAVGENPTLDLPMWLQERLLEHPFYQHIDLFMTTIPATTNAHFWGWCKHHGYQPQPQAPKEGRPDLVCDWIGIDPALGIVRRVNPNGNWTHWGLALKNMSHW